MATKEEYIKALNGMEEVYDNLDGCMSAMNIFKEGVNLLTGLINEHFEEKQETNFEHYKDEIIENCIDNIAVVKEKPHGCMQVPCKDCKFYTCENSTCHKKTVEWLKKPYEKPTYKLAQFEFDLLRTNNISHEKKLKDFATYRNLKEIGYFKNVDLNLTINEVLNNCYVEENEER